MSIRLMTGSLVTLLLFTLFVSPSLGQEGYWKFLRVEKAERDKQTDEGSNVSWSGDAGRMLFTIEAKQAVAIDKPPYREDQKISATYTWDKPPEILIAGKKVNLNIKCQVNFNSHPNQAMGLGGQATAWFGWTPAPAGAMSFRDKKLRDKYILAFETYEANAPASVIKINKQAASLAGVLEVPVAHPDERVENEKKIAPICVSLRAGSTDKHVFQYIYQWHPGAPPADNSGITSTDNATVNVAGIWKHGDNAETWTLVPLGKDKYEATETGFGNASGTATVSGNKVTIDYVTADGKTKGTYVITIASDGTSGVGKWTEAGGNSGERNFTKIGSVASPTKTGSSGETSKSNQPIGDSGSAIGAAPIPKTGIVLQIESKSVKEGESTTVPVWLHRAADLANMNFEVSYHSDIAKAEKVSKGKLLPNATAMESNVGEAGIIRIGFAGKGNLSGTGPVAYIPFTAVGKAGSKTPLTLKVTTAASASNSEPEVQLVHGFIEIVSAAKPGDSNGNGILDSGDALDALKMSVQLMPENLAADFDKDGKVTSTDARLILEQVVKQAGVAQ